ncbi:hypothetical protein D3C80_1690420 [compost metagenome]
MFANSGRNLLSKDDCRLALFDEIEPDWCEVSFVGFSALFSGNAEGLARAGACPDWAVIWPPSKAQGVTPDADPGKEMALSVVFEVIGFHIHN